MPDAEGKIRGIQVPQLPWVTVSFSIPQARALAYGKGSLNKSYRAAHEEAVEAVRKAYEDQHGV